MDGPGRDFRSHGNRTFFPKHPEKNRPGFFLVSGVSEKRRKWPPSIFSFLHWFVSLETVRQASLIVQQPLCQVSIRPKMILSPTIELRQLCCACYFQHKPTEIAASAYRW